jgi:hypothetical protein
MKQKQKKYVFVQLPAELGERFKKICQKNRRKMTDQIAVWVDAEEAKN